MGFSEEWDLAYKDNTHMSVWPWSDVVSLVHRHCKRIIQSEAGRKVLELGCGAGANIPFFLALQFDYKALEGSPAIVERLHQRYPDLADSIACGDFSKDQPFSNDFDLVLDRASITHNATESIERALELVYKSLKAGGLFIGVDWFSTKHSEFNRGVPADDEYTKAGFADGQFSGLGRVHFSDESHLRGLLKNFEIIFLEEKLARQFEPKNGHTFASWNIVARKRHA